MMPAGLTTSTTPARYGSAALRQINLWFLASRRIALTDHAALDEIAAARLIAVGVLALFRSEQALPLPVVAACGQDVRINRGIGPEREFGRMSAFGVVACRLFRRRAGLAPLASATAGREQETDAEHNDLSHGGSTSWAGKGMPETED